MSTIFTLLHRLLNRGRTYDERKSHEKALRYRDEKERVISQRPPLLLPQRHNLSSTSLPEDSRAQTSSLAQYPQPSCPLFTKLPPEIRARIWAEVLGGNVFHLTNVDKRIRHQRYAIPDGDGEEADIPMTPPSQIKWTDERARIPAPGQFSHTSLALLKTCHAIYAEALGALYRDNIWSMSSPLVLLYLHRMVLRPQHFAQIQHIQLHWTYFSSSQQYAGRVHAPYDWETWESFWALVHGMGLRSLGVWLEYWGPEEVDWVESEWARPMFRVKGVGKVNLRVERRVGPWDRERLERLEGVLRRVWTSR